MKLNVTLIRHGKTQGNINHAYIGTTDENLSEIGISELKQRIASGLYPPAKFLYTSGLKRCIETATYIYPNKVATIKNDLRECDFGDFEGQNYDELKENPDYQRFLDSGGTIPFPNGEAPIEFAKRCQTAFAEIMSYHQNGDAVVIVCHGGTIMAILDLYSSPHNDFFNWQVKNTQGYSFIFDTKLQVATNIIKL